MVICYILHDKTKYNMRLCICFKLHHKTKYNMRLCMVICYTLDDKTVYNEIVHSDVIHCMIRLNIK